VFTGFDRLTSVEEAGEVMESSDHYVVISADGHAGASMDAYRQCLDPAFRDDFDAWRKEYSNPFADLRDTESLEY